MEIILQIQLRILVLCMWTREMGFKSNDFTVLNVNSCINIKNTVLGRGAIEKKYQMVWVFFLLYF